MNLLYCGNDKVFDGMMISVLSIIKYTKKPINIYVLTMDLTDIDEKNRPVTDVQIEYLQQIVREVNTASRVVLIDVTEVFNEEMASCVNMNNFYTPYCMLRLFCDRIQQLPDKLLYMDTDTVAMADIEGLYNIDITGYEYAGAIDYLGKIFKNVRYINSGVLLMNLSMIRETGLLEKTREKCRNKKMAFPDQDALNKLAVKKMRISSRYNSQRRLHNDTVVRHFCKSLRIFPYIHTINVKPWETDRMKNVLKITYLDDILDEYQRRMIIYNQIKMLGDSEHEREIY